MTTRRRPSDGGRTARFGVYLRSRHPERPLKAAIDAGVSATELVERHCRLVRSPWTLSLGTLR